MSVVFNSISKAHPTHRIWDPVIAARLSLPFSPIFGSLIHMLNWQTLGEQERAEESRKWLYASIAVVGVCLFINALASEYSSNGLIVGVAGLIYLFVWYRLSAQAQIRYVEESFGTDYAARPWVKVLLYTAGTVVGIGVVGGLLAQVVAAVVGAT